MCFKHKFTCPCCGYYTLDTRGEYDICPVCYWEDDPSQAIHPDLDGGANHISLNEARLNYSRFGASEKKWLHLVRTPKPCEVEPS